MKLSPFNQANGGNGSCPFSKPLLHIRSKVGIAPWSSWPLRSVLMKRRIVIIATLMIATGFDGRCGRGGGVISPSRISVLETAGSAHVLQAEPTVSFFGAEGTPIWIICHNDSTHRGADNPNASGITCESQNQRREFSVRVVVTGQAPFATNEPVPSTDPALAKDPVDPNTVWLAAIMNWDSIAGKRSSIGVAKLVRDPATGAVTVNEPNPGVFGDSHRMVPIGGTNIEGPVNANNGPSPDRPFIAIDPTAENGNHAQYIAFFQNDNSHVDQNQTRQRRGRIMVTHRNSPDNRFWSDPVVVRANTVPTDSDGWALDNDSYQFLSPQLAIRPSTHEVGIAFTRFQFHGDPQANITLDNSGFVGNPIFYFFGISPDRARTGWSVRSVTSTARAGVIDTGPATSRFTAAPYPVLAFDAAFNRWLIVFPTSGTARTPVDTGKWELVSSFSEDGSSWSPPIQVNNSPRFGADNPRSVVFPSITFDPQARRLTVGYLETNDVSDRTWRPVINFSSTGGDSWGPSHVLLAASQPRGSRLGEYTWQGHWANSSRAGFFGDYTGLASARGWVLFAWPESRESTSTAVIDVWGAETNLSD